MIRIALLGDLPEIVASDAASPVSAEREPAALEGLAPSLDGIARPMAVAVVPRLIEAGSLRRRRSMQSAFGWTGKTAGRWLCAMILTGGTDLGRLGPGTAGGGLRGVLRPRPCLAS